MRFRWKKRKKLLSYNNGVVELRQYTVKAKFIAIVTVTMLCSCSALSPQVDRSTQDCFQDYSVEMTAGQVAELLNIPLLTLTSLPDGVEGSPNVRPDVLYENERKSCGIAITYVNSEDKTISEIHIRIHKNATATSEYSSIQNCVSYSDTEFPFQSSCVGMISHSEAQLRIIILTRFSEERTRELAEQLLTQ